jgi:hypothetical protein
MREQLEQRLGELKTEQRKGEQILAEFEARQAGLQQTLLSIGGAIQVLEELLSCPDRRGSPAPVASGQG